jgi:hypothetical protein
MMHLARSLARGFAAALVAAGTSAICGCSSITMIEPDEPLEISARPPALPLPELPAVKQPPPPPPPRVVVEGELLRLDETIAFDERDELSADSQDILVEVATWLAANPDVLELTVHVEGTGEGKRSNVPKRFRGLAKQIVEALVQSGVAADRLVAKGGGGSKDEPVRVELRITERAEETPK